MINSGPVAVTSPASATEPPADSATWVIEPRQAGLGARTREIWQYRRLIRFFAARAVEKLYRRTILGVAWIVIRPLFPLLVKTLIFGGLLEVASEGVPYFLFLVVGSTAWDLFAQSVTWATRSLEINRSFLSRIYVPRIILPVSMTAIPLVNFGIHLAVFAAALIWYRVQDGVWYVSGGLQALWMIPAALLALALALAISLWTSVPALIARDVRFTVGYVLGFWVYLTPVFYPLSSVSPRWQPVMALNPMATVAEMFKFGALGIGTVNPTHIATSVAVCLVVAASGVWYFMRAEATAADRV
jgi:lipopolysaccharide transport system permease protein